MTVKNNKSLLINRKICYKYYNYLLTDFRNIENSDLKIINNINTSNDIKVLLGFLKRKSSLFKSDTNNLIENFGLDTNLVNIVLDEYSSIILSFFKQQKEKLDLLGIRSDNNIDELNELLDSYRDTNSFNTKKVLEEIIKNTTKAKSIKDNEEIYISLIPQYLLIEYYKKNINSIDYIDFIDELKQSKIIETTGYDKEKEEIYYILNETTLDSMEY